MREKVEKNLASKKPKDLAERAEYYMSTRKYAAAIVACSQWIAAGPTRQKRRTWCAAAAWRISSNRTTRKRLSISTKRCVSRTSPATKRACVFTGRLAYAGQDGTLDKAMNDLAKIEDISPGGPDDFSCCRAFFCCAAVRIRRLHTGAVKGKAQARATL